MSQIRGTSRRAISSPVNDAADAVFITSAEAANRLGVKPRARLHSFAVVGDHAIHGGSGARIMTTLLSVLEQTGGRYGLQTMREAGGLANATIIERL
jgi:acetyl-CoA acetyltransferase